MRIAIPVLSKEGLSAQVAQHFGRCPAYAVLDETGQLIEYVENTSEHNGGQGLPPEVLRDHNIQVLVCLGIGPRALHLCRDFDMVVYCGDAPTVETIFNQWRAQSLSPAMDEDTCEGNK